MKKILITLLSITALTSCYMNRNYTAKSGLHYTGVYTVQTVHGRTVTFKELPSETYYIESDTLKVNDRITINVIRDTKSSRLKNNLVKN